MVRDIISKQVYSKPSRMSIVRRYLNCHPAIWLANQSSERFIAKQSSANSFVEYNGKDPGV
jgi:hypothetical protein